MGKDAELSTNEKEFILSSLKEGIRLDDRDKHEFRPLQILLGPDYGRSEVKLGGTKVLAKVSCEVTRPHLDRSSEGILILNTELSPMAFPEEEVNISRILEKAIKRNHAIDLEGLCIIREKKVWTIRVDIHFLDNDGNILDAAGIATISALAHFRRPEITITGEDTITIHSAEQLNPVPLVVHHIPICVTFAFFEISENKDLWVVDPTWQEEKICQGDMTIVINDHKEICVLSKAGGVPLSTETIIHCSKIATSKVEIIIEYIRKSLEVANVPGDFFIINNTTTSSPSFFPNRQISNIKPSPPLPSIPLSPSTKTKEHLFLGDNGSIEEDAKFAIIRSTTVFINHLAKSANQISKDNKRKIIQTDDVFEAVKECDLDEFLPRLEVELNGTENFYIGPPSSSIVTNLPADNGVIVEITYPNNNIIIETDGNGREGEEEEEEGEEEEGKEEEGKEEEGKEEEGKREEREGETEERKNKIENILDCNSDLSII
ncbi:3435_t:CDS:10 [Diversispora eburnea]|uniref:3435_t:CDS:1 n=1 Tax=Diversispora eburnea TaxID=1213867 RepID=A0A9N8VPK7_9GLOM|nr:3435_t:CDS:10 [Diversispora eburnea]